MVIAGVDAGGTKVLAIVVDESGQIVRRNETPTDPSSVTESIFEALRGVVGSDLSAIGLAVAGWIEYPSGRLLFGPNIKYEEPDLGALLSKRFGVDVDVENDANAAAWAEWRFGAARDRSPALMLTVGTGIGGGVVIDGSLFRGHRGVASEFGHMTVLEGGPRCACGLEGCLEALASGTAIEREGRVALGDQGLTGEQIAARAADGDAKARRVLEDAGTWLGIGISSLVSALDPQIVVVGGGVAEDEIFMSAVRDEVARRTRGGLKAPPIVKAMMGNDSGAIGAADLARLKMENQ